MPGRDSIVLCGSCFPPVTERVAQHSSVAVERAPCMERIDQHSSDVAESVQGHGLPILESSDDESDWCDNGNVDYSSSSDSGDDNLMTMTEAPMINKWKRSLPDYATVSEAPSKFLHRFYDRSRGERDPMMWHNLEDDPGRLVPLGRPPET